MAAAVNTITVSHKVHCQAHEPANLFVQRKKHEDMLKHFEETFVIDRVRKYNDEPEDAVTFEMKNIATPLANAIRRIMIAEVPTIAIENVWVIKNNSVMQDEMLAHRLGLIPIKADPKQLVEKGKDELAHEGNTLLFTLKIECTPELLRARGSPDSPYLEVMSSDLKWVPQGNQLAKFTALDSLPQPVHKDIVITQLKLGQQLNLELHAHKGIGADHAKFSPVCTASYRMLPEIELKRDFFDAEARELVQLEPLLFSLQQCDKSSGHEVRAVITDPRKCTASRACLRHDRFGEDIRVFRNKEHFIFSVESTGAIPAREVVVRAFALLRDKSLELKHKLLLLRTEMNKKKKKPAARNKKKKQKQKKKTKSSA